MNFEYTLVYGSGQQVQVRQDILVAGLADIWCGGKNGTVESIVL